MEGFALEQLVSEVIRLEVPHRFWTFSIPKRLWPYFRQRKRLAWLVQAAKESIYLAIPFWANTTISVKFEAFLAKSPISGGPKGIKNQPKSLKIINFTQT